jgi:amidase
MARFVEDLSLTLPIIAGEDGKDVGIAPVPLGDPRAVDLKRLRIAFHTDNGIKSPTAETKAAVKASAQALSEAGLAVEEDCPVELERGYLLLLRFYGVNNNESWWRQFLQKIGTTEPSPLLQRFIDFLRLSYVLSTFEFLELVREWDTWRSTMLSFLDKYDVILCPVSAYPALPHGTTMSFNTAHFISYTNVYNLAGWPAVAVRAGTSPEDLPIGVQVVARPWRDDVALAIAQHIETALGGWQRPPL